MARERRYAIDTGGPRRLTLRWKGLILKNVEVELDGVVLGPPIPDLSALREGREFPTPDGRTIRVFFENKFAGGGLAATIDGRPVPGANNDPRTAIRAAAILLWVIAGINLLFGTLTVALNDGRGVAFALPVVVAAVLAGLGFAVFKYRSRVAIVVAVVLEAVDAVATIALTASAGRTMTTGIFFRVFIIAALIRAYRAVAEAQRVEQEELVDTFR